MVGVYFKGGDDDFTHDKQMHRLAQCRRYLDPTRSNAKRLYKKRSARSPRRPTRCPLYSAMPSYYAYTIGSAVHAGRRRDAALRPRPIGNEGRKRYRPCGSVACHDCVPACAVSASHWLVAFTVSIFAFALRAPLGRPGHDHRRAGAQRRRRSSRSAIQYGLDRPLPVQYFDGWLGTRARGDFGRSFFFQEPVADLIADRLPITLTLGAARARASRSRSSTAARHRRGDQAEQLDRPAGARRSP